MPIWKLFAATRQPPGDLLRLAAADEGVHVAQRGCRRAVHDHEHTVQSGEGPLQGQCEGGRGALQLELSIHKCFDREYKALPT